MPTKILGVTVRADAALMVLLTKQDNDDFTVDDQTTMILQDGPRPEAYNTLHGQFTDYACQRRVQCVCVKGSAVSRPATMLVHLQAAELRGVIQAAAAASGAEVRMMTKAVASRTFGTRKVDEYLKDDTFWTGYSLATVKKGMREAAFVALSEFTS